MISDILYVMTHKQLRIGFLKDYRVTGYTQQLHKVTAPSNQVSSAVSYSSSFSFYLDSVMKLFESCRLVTELGQAGLLIYFSSKGRIDVEKGERPGCGE